MVILSGSNMRADHTLKNIGIKHTAASQAASITPRQNRLSLVGMHCHL
jgi:hypothetical protein